MKAQNLVYRFHRPFPRVLWPTLLGIIFSQHRDPVYSVNAGPVDYSAGFRSLCERIRRARIIPIDAIKGFRCRLLILSKNYSFPFRVIRWVLFHSLHSRFMIIIWDKNLFILGIFIQYFFEGICDKIFRRNVIQVYLVQSNDWIEIKFVL